MKKRWGTGVALLLCGNAVVMAADPPRYEELSNPQSQSVGRKLCNGNTWVPMFEPCPGSGSSSGGRSKAPGPATPEVPRPIQLTPSEAQSREQGDREFYAYTKASRERAEAHVAEAEKWLSIDRAKAIAAYQRACDEVWALRGCGMVGELRFEDLEDSRPYGDRSPPSDSFRAAAESLLRRIARGCEQEEQLACFVQRRIRMALNLSYLGPDLNPYQANAFAQYDEERRNLALNRQETRRQQQITAELARLAAEEAHAQAARDAVTYAGTSPAAIIVDHYLQSDQPLEQLKEALRRDPNYFPALLFISWEYKKAKDFDKAADALRRAETVCPADAALRKLRLCFDEPYRWVSMGDVWRDIGKLPEAERAYQRAVVEYTRPAPANATEDVRQAAEKLQSEAFLAWLPLADVQRAARKPKDAMLSVDKGLLLAPGGDRSADFWRAKGDILIDLNKPDDALAAYTKASELNRYELLYQIKIADALCAAGQREQALALFESKLNKLYLDREKEAAQAVRARCVEPPKPAASPPVATRAQPASPATEKKATR